MELKRILKFRNVWLGLAMGLIVFFHSGFWSGSFVFSLAKTFAYCGVDICVFASGIGCYFSLQKDPDVIRFLKRRVKRLAPVYYCFIAPWLVWRMTVSPMPLGAVLGNLLGVQSLFSWEYHFNWYISGLVVYYLLMPLLKKIADSCSSVWQDVLAGICLLAVTLIFRKNTNISVILARIPVLYAGVVIAKLANRGFVLKMKDYLLLGIAMAAGGAVLLVSMKLIPDVLWNSALCWYPFALIIPGGCIVVSLLAEQLEKRKSLKWINKAVGLIGIYSFELYLVHDFLYEGLMSGIVSRFGDVPNNLLWAMTLPVVACGTYLLNRAAAWAVKLLNKKEKA